MKRAHELWHIDMGSEPGESVDGIGIVTFLITADGDVADVLQRVRDVLRVVIAQPAAGWPTVDEWRMRLPAWFTEACGPEMSSDEAGAWLQRWRSLSQDEQNLEEETRAWSLADWLYWFEPATRMWHWWDAAIETADLARIALAVTEWPFPWGAFKWLCRVAGASTIESAGDDAIDSPIADTDS